MSENYVNNLKRTIPLSIGIAILAYILSYLSLPTNIAYTFWGLLLILAVSYYVMSTSEEGNRYMVSFSLVIISGLLIGSLFISPLIFTRIDNAKYFDDLLIYTDENELPFQTRINGSELRVVDRDLAESIMDKTAPFGANRDFVSVHLGNYQGNIYWIGAAVFDGIILNDQNNRVNGFILVDITDPEEEVIVLREEFLMDGNLILNRDADRRVWMENINYIISENSYFSYNDIEDQMELIVPYSIQDSAFLGDSHGGLVTSDMNLDGGVLIFGPDGEVIRDYSATEREELPDHAKIQVYSETWLEDQITWWGQSLVNDNEVRWDTVLPWVRSERLLGIDDDVRVVINPDNFESVQYTLLDSTDSSNQILRGAIKANTSGLYYYNFERFQFIDTNSAHGFIEETITNLRETSTHGYKPLLPILYPVAENVTSLRDYAYVMPLQFGETSKRFGGIAIANPADKTGSQSIVEFVEPEEPVNVASTVARALDRYQAAVIEGGNETTIPNDQTIGNFTVDDIRSFEESGSTVYAMEGNFTEEIGNLGIDGDVRILFSQDFITNEEMWLDVVFTDVGDVLSLQVEIVDGNYYAISVEIISRA